jgi:DNA-binding response OmpR family regulator
MATTKVLIIEDDLRLARMVIGFLEQNAFTCIHASDANTGLAAFRQSTYDLVLLDLMLPDADGLDVCRELRAQRREGAETPIIMVTARGDLSDRVTGLEMGADDYLPKPFEPRELLARARAVLRRTLVDRARPGSEVLVFGRLEIDRRTRQVRLSGQPKSMTSLQFDLLVVMAQNAGRVLSRDQLRQNTRGDPAEAFDRSIDVHIGKIRSAIEDDVRFPKRIVTVRNVGYVFSKTDPADGSH